MCWAPPSVSASQSKRHSVKTAFKCAVIGHFRQADSNKPILKQAGSYHPTWLSLTNPIYPAFSFQSAQPSHNNLPSLLSRIHPPTPLLSSSLLNPPLLFLSLTLSDHPPALYSILYRVCWSPVNRHLTVPPSSLAPLLQSRLGLRLLMATAQLPSWQVRPQATLHPSHLPQVPEAKWSPRRALAAAAAAQQLRSVWQWTGPAWAGSWP